MVVEREGRAHHQKPLRPGEPVEGDVQGLADVAAGAVGADEETALEASGAAVPGYHRGDARRVFFHPGHFAGEEHFRPGHTRQLLVQQPVELELLALEPVWVRRDVGDASEVELGDAARALAVLKGRGLEAHGQKIVQHPGGGQHVDGGRMEGGGPQRFRQRRFRFQHGHRHPVLRQVQRHHEPHGSGTRHQHAIGAHVTTMMLTRKCPHPSFRRNRLYQKANFEVRKATPSFPRKRESRGRGGVLQQRSPAPPRLDSRFRGNDDSWGLCLAGMAF